MAGAESEAASSDTRYIFVHGLSGWGSYDSRYLIMPYWGMFGGDLIKYLNEKGFSSYAASVAPEGSAWDRACELYAQLSGTVTDYGKAHSEKYGHERFGRDFSKDPLIPDWEDGCRIVVLGHSFGGATVRLFSEILANGSAEEQEATAPEELSSFFKGGQQDRLHALVTLAAPTNGTTAYDINAEDAADESAYRKDDTAAVENEDTVAENEDIGAENEDTVAEDTAAYDMHIDNALALNERIATLPGTYYFAIPCSATEQAEDGTQKPVKALMERMFLDSATAMGCYTGTTPGGVVIDESWQENDGLVNTISAMAPFGAPETPYDPENIKPGIWNVMPTYIGDHMALQGGMLKVKNIRPFYLDLLGMIDGLPLGQGNVSD